MFRGNRCEVRGARFEDRDLGGQYRKQETAGTTTVTKFGRHQVSSHQVSPLHHAKTGSARSEKKQDVSVPSGRAIVVLPASPFQDGPAGPFFFFCITLDRGPGRPLGLKLRDTKAYAPQVRARLGLTGPACPSMRGPPPPNPQPLVA